MSPRFDVWRWDQAGFLDRVDQGIQAKDPEAAIGRSQKARNGHLYVALPTRLTAKPRDPKGRVLRS